VDTTIIAAASITSVPARDKRRKRRAASLLTPVVMGSVALISVLAAAVTGANIYYDRSSRGHDESFSSRGDVVQVELASKLYWHEREAMNEYLLAPSPELLVEVLAESAAVESTLNRIDESSSYERSLLLRAHAANWAFTNAFVGDLTKARGVVFIRKVSAKIDRRGRSVLPPLNALARVNAEEVTVTQAATARATARLHLFVGLAFLIFALTIVFWAIRGTQLVRRIAAQNRELKLLDSAKDDFVASVSHELRTPLTSIRGYVELMLDEETGPLNETQRKFLSVVERSTERQMLLIGDLLLVAQLGNGELHLELEPVEVGALVEEAVEAARPTANAKGIALAFATDHRPANVLADGPRLAQVLDNLISNAIKFTPAGSVSVQLSSDGDEAVIDVVDTGMGIPPDEQARLFERFFRAAAANTNRIQGTGLGLSIAQAIADGHAGTIALNRSDGDGTTFRLTLPLAIREREGGIKDL
jgi:signal transduction histidine kinase